MKETWKRLWDGLVVIKTLDELIGYRNVFKIIEDWKEWILTFLIYFELDGLIDGKPNKTRIGSNPFGNLQ